MTLNEHQFKVTDRPNDPVEVITIFADSEINAFKRLLDIKESLYGHIPYKIVFTGKEIGNYWFNATMEEQE